jgi:outer membrane protein assembly factor BamB
VKPYHYYLALLLTWLAAGAARGDDWPAWGRDLSRNAVSPEKGAPLDFAFEFKDSKGNITTRAKNVRWSVPAGSRLSGGPVVASGLVWVGTNNWMGRDRPSPDASVLLCLREADGKELYRYVSPRRREGWTHDFSYAGMGSTPTVEGDRLWFVSNRAEVVCLDIGPLQKGTGEAKVAWKVDLMKEYGVYPHNPMMQGGFQASVAVYKDWVYAVTGNAVDEGHTNIPAPNAPSLVCLEKATGKLVWKNNSPGKNILQHQISSPLVGEFKNRAQVIVGQGDGWLRSFDPATGKVLWECDLNPKDAKWQSGGRGTKNYIVATPIAYDGRVYVSTGVQIEAAFGGPAYVYCIDPTRDGDVSRELEEKRGKGKPNPNSAVLWRYGGPEIDSKADRDVKFGRTVSNAVAHGGLVYVPDAEGYFCCFDVKDGKLLWSHDTKAEIRTSPLWADGKVYLMTTDAVLIFADGREKKLLKEIDLPGWGQANPIFANGTLYIPTNNGLFAVREKP